VGALEVATASCSCWLTDTTGVWLMFFVDRRYPA